MGGFVTDVSFRLAKDNVRVILTPDVMLASRWDVLINLDSDDPGSSPRIMTNMRHAIQKLRAASISGYSPLTPKGLGYDDRLRDAEAVDRRLGQKR